MVVRKGLWILNAYNSKIVQFNDVTRMAFVTEYVIEPLLINNIILKHSGFT